MLFIYLIEFIVNTISVLRLLLKYFSNKISPFKIRNSIITLLLADIVLIIISNSRLSGFAK
jgi:hypothetical protein